MKLPNGQQLADEMRRKLRIKYWGPLNGRIGQESWGRERDEEGTIRESARALIERDENWCN